MAATREPVHVLYFAAARERAGVVRESLPLAGLSVGDARRALAERHPRVGEILIQCRTAVGETFVDDDHILQPGVELAVLPPVAGGDARAPAARVLDRPLLVDEVLDRVAHPGAGAQVLLIGVVRDHASDDGVAIEAVEALDYEAYVPMAERVIASIVAEVEAALPGVRGAVDHRVGSLAIGDRAVVVAASSAHRAEAFDACRAIIDRLKEDAPIWKHERRASGQVWVGLGP